MFSRKEMRTIALVALLTVSILFLVDKITVSFQMSTRPSDGHVPSSKDRSVVINLKEKSGTQQPQQYVEPVELIRTPHIVTDNVAPPHPHSVSKAENITASPGIQLFNNKQQCSRELELKYGTSSGSNWQENLKWCEKKKDLHHVSIGRSWGSLSKLDKQQWDLYKCNELMSVGKLQSCDQRWGWGAFREWLGNAVPVVQGVSKVNCARDYKTSIFCQVCMYYTYILCIVSKFLLLQYIAPPIVTLQ